MYPQFVFIDIATIITLQVNESNNVEREMWNMKWTALNLNKSKFSIDCSITNPTGFCILILSILFLCMTIYCNDDDNILHCTFITRSSGILSVRICWYNYPSSSWYMFSVRISGIPGLISWTTGKVIWIDFFLFNRKVINCQERLLKIPCVECI